MNPRDAFHEDLRAVVDFYTLIYTLQDVLRWFLTDPGKVPHDRRETIASFLEMIPAWAMSINGRESCFNQQTWRYAFHLRVLSSKCTTDFPPQASLEETIREVRTGVLSIKGRELLEVVNKHLKIVIRSKLRFVEY